MKSKYGVLNSCIQPGLFLFHTILLCKWLCSFFSFLSFITNYSNQALYTPDRKDAENNSQGCYFTIYAVGAII